MDRCTRCIATLAAVTFGLSSEIASARDGGEIVGGSTTNGVAGRSQGTAGSESGNSETQVRSPVLSGTAGEKKPSFDGRIRLNYGLQHDNVDSFVGPSGRDYTYANRLLQGEFRIKYQGYELSFDGYVRQDDNGDFNTTDHTTILNRLYATVPLGESFKLKVGRQRALWGHGFVYVPTDFINPPLDPSGLDLANARGVDSITLDYYKKQYTLTFLYNFDESADREGFGLKLTSSATRNIDWNLIYYHAPQSGHAGGITFSTDPVAWFKAQSDGSIQAFANFAVRQRSHYYEPLDPATGLLGLPTRSREDQPFFTFLTGLSHEIPRWTLSTRVEYYYIGDAYGRSSLESILSGIRSDLPTYHPWINRLAYGRSQRHYVNLAVGQTSLTQNSGHRFANTLGYGFGALHGLNDQSTLLVLNVNSTYFDRFKFEMNTLVPVGRRSSEFGSMPFRWRIDLSVSYFF